MRIDAVDERILFFLKDGPARRRELGALAPTKRVGKRRMEKLIKNDFVSRTEEWGVYELGSQGRAYLNSLTSPSSSFKDPKLLKIINRFPTEAHRAFMRLTLSGIVAKKLLFNEFDSNWPFSIIIGATKALKTVSLEVICRLIKGLDPLRNIFPLYSGSPGEFGVRRYRVKGKVAFQISESRLFKEIFAGLDEWDKASPQLKMKALFFTEGKREFLVEEKKVVNHAYAVIAANPEPTKLTIPEPIIRRSVVLNTESLRSQLRDVDLAAREIVELLSSPGAPQLDLQRLPVIRKKLSKQNFIFLRTLFMDNVKENHSHLVDTAPLEILALGRASLSKSKDIRQAILETIWDRLECLETMGGAKELWRERLADTWEREGSVPSEMLARLKKIQKMKAKTTLEKEKATAHKVKKIKKSLAFTAHKEKIIAQLRELRNELPQTKKWKNRSFPVRKKIKNLIRQLQGVRKEEDLELYERVLPEIEAEVTTVLFSCKGVPDKEEKKDSSTKILQKLMEDWIERKRTLAQDNILEKLKSVGCIHERFAQRETCSGLVTIRFLTVRGFQKIPSVFVYYEGVDGKIYFPEELNSWDKARPLLVRRLQQLEKGEEDTKFVSEENRLKDMVDWVLKHPEEWPQWFKKEYNKLVEGKINGLLKNPQQWPKWFQTWFFKSLNEKVDQRLNEEFQRQVSTQVAKEVQRLKTILFPQYIDPKVAEITRRIQENVFKALQGPWYGITCPNCHGEVEVTLGEKEVKKLVKSGKISVACPHQRCRDVFGGLFWFSIRLEDLIRAYLAL